MQKDDKRGGSEAGTGAAQSGYGKAASKNHPTGAGGYRTA